MAEETRVEPGVLDGLARTARDLGDDLKRSAGWVEPVTGAAVGALRGFDSGNALERLHLAWEDAATGFAGHLGKLGDALGTCAREYSYADHASAGNFAGLDR